MRLSTPLLAVSLLAACGGDNTTSNSGTETGGSSGTTQPGPSTTDPEPTSTSTTEAAPTEASGTVGMTDGGTTTGTGATTTTGESATDTGTTNPVDTDPDPGTSTTTTGPDETTGTSGPPPDTSSSGDESSTGPLVEPCECPDLEVALDDGIFVLSLTAELWKFFPENNSFQQLGPLNCPGLAPTTFSMAVDRSGYAWVQYQGGQLRKIAVTNVADCTDPGYQLGQTAIANFGMAFVSNSQFDACDRIYGNTASGISEGNQIADFFSIDPDTLKVQPISKSDYGSAEVTGTGDGRAFFFAGANPAKLIEINKNTGAKGNIIPLNGVELGSAWAFAFFAGDFYFFTNSQGGPGSEVTHIDYDDSDKNGKQDITTVVANAPISIVGAGVSTCAPTAPQ